MYGPVSAMLRRVGLELAVLGRLVHDSPEPAVNPLRASGLNCAGKV